MGDNLVLIETEEFDEGCIEKIDTLLDLDAITDDHVHEVGDELIVDEIDIPAPPPASTKLEDWRWDKPDNMSARRWNDLLEDIDRSIL